MRKPLQAYSFFATGLILLAACLFMSSCANNSHAEAEKKDSSGTHPDPMSLELRFTADMLDNKKDPSCGMPVTAGMSDTAHYHGKVIGFCSKECKAEFQKSPDKYIAAAEMK
ncbi:YHS domain-containing protein [Asinibacterium sp. OR53]|uniref:YHS domain-containing protein n=1 Tax=Asinibacterium sp. OR53 TaxID=925409 RepID=UPI00041D48D1|nr:YHS domain-containing protein [Asinibacterium sp. OR53]